MRSKRTLISALCLALVCAVPTLQASTALADTSTSVIFDYGSSGWHYADVAPGSDPGFEAPTYDDSAWPNGQAAFGTTDGTCEWNNSSRVHTTWTPNTDMLVRKQFSLPSDASSLHLDGTVDNGAQIYVNGTEVASASGGFCEGDNISVDIPLGLVSTNNVLAIRGTDDGSATFLDVKLTAQVQPLPNLDAGTFTKFLYSTGGGEACTTGFALVKSGTRYEIGAKHCIDAEQGSQANNSKIHAHQPMTITTSDSAFTFAQSIDCSPPSPSACLLPTATGSATGDMMAWRPDASVPSDMVQTAHGLLPVIGEKIPAEVAGTQVCHYGFGSANNGTKQAERCDAKAPGRARAVALCATYSLIFRINACPDGTMPIAATGFPGDSGGPVYQYAIANGQPYGVYAVGIAIIAGAGETTYIPIATVERRLGATLVTQ